MQNPKSKARQLVNRLQRKARKNPASFCENYGQKEIRKFKDRLQQETNLSYREECEVHAILNRVDEITPYN